MEYWLLDADTFALDYLLRDRLGDPAGVPPEARLASFEGGDAAAERRARRQASELIREARAGMVLVVRVRTCASPPRTDPDWTPLAYSARWQGEKYGWRLLCSLWRNTGPNQETPCENPDGPWMAYRPPSREPQSRPPVCEHCHVRLGPTPKNREVTAEINRAGRRKKDKAR